MQKVDMGKQAWDENQVDGPIAQYLIGDAEVAAGRVRVSGSLKLAIRTDPIQGIDYQPDARFDQRRCREARTRITPFP